MTDDERERLNLARYFVYDCLLGDINTFLLGVERVLECPGLEGFGGGNLSLAILSSAALEVLAQLHTGKAKLGQESGYNATDNVQSFLEDHFPGDFCKIGHVLWDGMRNGPSHSFAAKKQAGSDTRVRVGFRVGDAERCMLIPEGDCVHVVIAHHEFARLIKQAADSLFSSAETDPGALERVLHVLDKTSEYWRDTSHDTRKETEQAWAKAAVADDQAFMMATGTVEPAARHRRKVLPVQAI